MVRLRRMAPDVYDPTGLVPIGERQLRCIDPSHDEPCQVCSAPPGHGEDSFWSLRGDPRKRNGDKKLRTLIQMTREWNSPVERAHLVHYLQNNPETAHMTKVIEIVRRKETPRLSKMCMMVLARAWGFKSEIWVRKCFSQPFYQYLEGGQGAQDKLKGQGQQQNLGNGHLLIQGGGGGPTKLNRNTSGDIGSDSGNATNTTTTIKSLTPSKKKVTKQEKEAMERKNKIERSAIAKFTNDLEQAQSLMAVAVDQANGAKFSPVEALEQSAFNNQKAFYVGVIRSTGDLLLQLKPACEECLSMLQQVQEFPHEMQEVKPWAYINHLKQVDKFQSDFEQVFWTGGLSCQMDATVPTSKQIQDIVFSASNFHASVLKLCTTGKCEIAHARNTTFGDYCITAMACLKVFYVIIIEISQKISELRDERAKPEMNSPPSYMSTSGLNAPVLTSHEMPSVANTDSSLPDCLKLLRSLSNEIVLPRSISNEINFLINF